MSGARQHSTPDGRSPETAISVSALNEGTRRMLEDRVPRLWVRGEVASWTVSHAGHRYFSLRDGDEDARVDCVFFQGDAWRLPADPEVGTEVFALGQPTLYTKQGRFQLLVRSLETAGEGLWRVAFERLRRLLEAEGLLAPERKRALPAFPRRIGIVTSRSGAALHDVLTVLRRRSPWVDVIVRHCRVQGEGAALEIRDAIARLADWGGRDARGPLDTIILTRGGGATEDLWCFNEEIVVRAVATCPVPVICAIGHEVDVTLAELVADLRAPTPSAAAELAVPDVREYRESLDVIGVDLARGLRRLVTRGRDRVRGAERRLPRAVERTLESSQARLGMVARRLPGGVERALGASRGRLGAIAGRLDALSPLKTMARGYSVATDMSGSLLTRVEDFELEGRFRLRVLGGSVDATTDRVERAP